MSNILLWIVAGAVLVVGGFFLVSHPGVKMMNASEGGVADKQKDMMASASDTMKKDTDSMKKDSMMGKGSYETYTLEKISTASADHHVVLFFRASWCPTCKAVDADIRTHLGDIPGSLTILDVDYDNSTALKQKYGVTYQHTFVQVRADGSMIKKWSGSPTLSALIGNVQ